jgi:hypothetical protein
LIWSCCIEVVDINVKSIFHATNALVPCFLERRSGKIVNIGSCITEKPTTGLTWYGATKGAVDMITRHLAAENYPKGICVNGISPSIGETALLREFIAQEPDVHNKASLAASASLNRLCTPLDVAKGALYFATPYFNDFQTRESPTPVLLLLINLLQGHYSSSGRGKLCEYPHIDSICASINISPLDIESVLASTNTTVLKRPRFNPVHQ